MSGLRANQARCRCLGERRQRRNAGYVRKTANQVQMATGAGGCRPSASTARSTNTSRRSLRTETSGASYAAFAPIFCQLRTSMAIRRLLDAGGDLQHADQARCRRFRPAESQSARTAVINAAQAPWRSSGIRRRKDPEPAANAESGLSNAVSVANNAMAQIAKINNQVQGNVAQDASTAALLDHRDQYITQLSQLMDIRVVSNGGNQVSIFTNAGVQLVGADAAQLAFDAQGTVTPNTVWDSDPAKSNLGSIVINFPNGGSIDLIASNSIRSGSIAAYLELRDKTLVQAQEQVDQLAASLASALSDKTTSTPATSGTQSGFSFNLAAPQNGNVIRLSYTNTVTGQTHNVSVVLVNDPSVRR